MVLRINVLVEQMLANKYSNLSQKTDNVILHSMSLCTCSYMSKNDVKIVITLFQTVFKKAEGEWKSNRSPSLTEKVY